MKEIRTKIEVCCECPKCKFHFIVAETINKNNKATSEVLYKEWIEEVEE